MAKDDPFTMNKPFTLYVMQSAHTDIGYTHPADQVREMYLEHYDTLLALCERTRNAPERERFKWTCETFWQVRHYLNARPERLEEFLACVKRGQIEVTGSYLHFTDLIDEDAMGRSLDLAVRFRDEHNIPVRSALHCDINGWAWSLADQLAEREIPYFLSQVHLDSGTDPFGKRGSVHYAWLLEGMKKLLTPDAPVRIPHACWWQGPKGKRVLHWLGEHYMLGNVLGISSNRVFGGDKTRYFLETDRATADELLEVAREKVPAYVERMKQDGYALDSLLVSTGGYYVDNAPPDDRWLEVIRKWQGHDNIEMRTCTPSEWFAYLETQDTNAFPTFKAAWPDHWAHGLGSDVSSITRARRTQRRRNDAVTLAAQSGSERAKKQLSAALESERIALEHTFNAWSTSHRPGSGLNEFSQAVKTTTFHQAEMQLEESISSSLRALLPTSDSTQLHLRPSTHGIQVLHFNSGDMKLEADRDVLVAEDGTRIAFQVDHANLLNYVATVSGTVDKIKSLKVERADAAPTTVVLGAMGAPLVMPTINAPVTISSSVLSLESAGWHLTINPETGGLNELIQTQTKHNWVGSTGDFGFGQLVHEQVIHPLGRQAAHNLARFVALDVGSQFSLDALGSQQTFEHTTLEFTDAPRIVRGPVFDALELDGRSERLGQATIRWRNYHASPLVELVIDWNKRYCEGVEAAYVPFGFAAENANLEFETAGGFFKPGSFEAGGQIPGTVSSYYTVQRAAQISVADGARLLWLPVDAPLVMTQELNYNRWEATEPYTWNGYLASMPVNHYWHTNFATSQRGHLRLRYRFFVPEADLEISLRRSSPLEALGWR